jgi:hypothetical protein
MLLLEIGIVLLSVLVAFFHPDLGSQWFHKIELRLSQLGRHRILSIVFVGTLALVLRAALLPVEPIPQPAVHDEFSYLLMADTFSHGRLANPTHPMWEHFETFHVNQRPTYASMYYPAQGAFLALGQSVFGHPFWGVWLSGGLMCAAICWMLQGWFPPFWALLGASLAVIRLAAFSYWVNSYFGGCVAATGGALALGALPRIRSGGGRIEAVLMGVGFALLATSRPYEGLFFSLPTAGALTFWMFRSPSDLSLKLTRVIIPLGIVLAITGALLMYYFWRVTGSPLHTPYLINLANYNPVPFFPWSSIKAWPKYHHSVIESFYSGWSLNMYLMARQHPFLTAVVKIEMLGFFFLGPLFVTLFIMLGLVLPRGFSFKDINRKTRFLLLIAGTSMTAILLPIFANPHYAAPLVCVIYALIVTALQRVRHWRWRGKLTGIAIVRSVPTVAIILLLLRTAVPVLHIQNGSVPETWCSFWSELLNRAQIQAQLERLPGGQLVLVRYSPKHNPMEGWVYNHADIDGSKVVWANDMGSQNQELIDYFKDRKVWLVEPDASPARLSAYTYAPQESTANASY